MATDLLSLVGNVRGHFSSKENRAAKLLADWPGLLNKMECMTVRGAAQTETSRLSYGVLVVMETGIRVGNESSAEGWICDNQIVAKKDNPDKGIKAGDVIWRHPMFGQHVQTFGLTTLLNRHVKKRGRSVTLDFTGKKLVDQTLKLRRPCLIDYMPKGESNELWLGVTYHSLRKFVKKYIGRKFMPKDLRTAVVNLQFARLFSAKHAHKYAVQDRKGPRKAILSECIEEVANQIGHTKSVCRSAYLSQEMMEELMRAEPGELFVHDKEWERP